MAQAYGRRLALRFCLKTVGLLGCLFLWVCVLSFDVADPPADTVWPRHAEPANLCGAVGAQVAFHLFRSVGVGTYGLLGLVTAAVLAWLRPVRPADAWMRLIGLVLFTAAISSAGALLIAPSEKHLVSGPGGFVGVVLAGLLRENFQLAGSYIVLSCVALVGLMLAADELVLHATQWLGWTGRRSIPVLARGGTAVAGAGAALATGVVAGVANLSGRLGSNGQRRPPPTDKQPDVPAAPASARQLTFDAEKRRPAESLAAAEPPLVEVGRLAPGTPVPAARPTERARPPAPEPPSAPQPEPARPAAPAPAARPPEAPPAESRPPVRRIEPRSPTPREEPRPAPAAAPEPEYHLPAIDLLERPVAPDKESIEILCREKAFILEQTLNEFRVTVQVVAIETGPVITVFELKLAPGIKVSQIASLTNDMARALKAPAVRVVAPLPGKNTIGIEVPNIDKEKVRLRDIMETFGRRADGCALPLYLGKDASGQPLVTDLTRMPHLLIAGTTGSGKSICVSSIISSFLMTRGPADLNLILVDPKMVELASYKDIPHLMCPIVTDTTKAEAILDWAATMMDERYALLAEAGVRDIRSYNRLGRPGLKERLDIASDEELARIPAHLPYVVIVIDELADLMMTSPKEVEFFLCRLAQKSRAVGIHLIVSTQRPQANVVTGLIKSNLPCRICFRVSSRLDSRIVLDQNGGETLMGQGDMLFLPPGSSKLVRAQGTFVSEDELRAMVGHCRQQRPPAYHPELVRMPGGAASASERDELFDQAVEITLETGRGSVSLLQRRLTIGYGRASRLIDQMYEAGIVGEYKGSQAREVIITQDEWAAARQQRDREEAEEAAAEVPASGGQARDETGPAAEDDLRGSGVAEDGTDGEEPGEDEAGAGELSDEGAGPDGPSGDAPGASLRSV